MPLIKRGSASGTRLPTSAETPPRAASHASLASRLADLRSAEAERRWRAARALGRDPEVVPALAAALRCEPVARVREAITTALLRIGTEASVAVLIDCLRCNDAGLRAAAIEALQALPTAVRPFVEALLADADSDVRILATELMRNMPERDVTELLCRLIEHEPHPNVCAAAIEVLTEAGTSDAIPVLEACSRRFAHDPFLPFAISVAIARISGTEG